MAEYKFTVDDFSLTSTWNRNRYGGSQGESITTSNLTSASVTKSFAISGISLADNENIKRVMLTATLNRVGTTDYAEGITVNGESFSVGSRKLDASTVTLDSNYDVKFYFCASGNAPATPAQWGVTSYSCTMYFIDVTLTITTGTGSAFDGLVSSLSEGSQLLVTEANGVQETYTLVHHNYNDGLCLFLRDSCTGVENGFNHSNDTFLSGNGGVLDEYLNTTFYESLPDETKSFIVRASYPTYNSRTSSAASKLRRYVCTPSVRELSENEGYAEGSILDYLETVNCGEDYWTRSISSTSGKAWRVGSSGSAYTYDRSYSTGVRPCFCVSESQLVVPSGNYYVCASACSAPTTLTLNGSEIDLTDQQSYASATLGWAAATAGTNVPIYGYAVYRCDTVDGTYEYLGETTASDDGAIPVQRVVHAPHTGFSSYYFKVQTLANPEMDYCNSPLSDAYRVISSKRTNIKYYDGTRWLLATPKHWDGTVWIVTEGAKYYDGTQWNGGGE